MPKIDHPLAVDPTDQEPLGRYLVSGPGHCASAIRLATSSAELSPRAG